MSHPLYVAFIWHQHQPLYKSRDFNADGLHEYRLPWVRLHGTKDYLDLVLILDKYPKLHQTVNLVPSLMLQLEDYAAGKAIDPYLAVALTDENKLTEQDKQFVVKHFFDGYYHTLVEPHPRYNELFGQRQDKGHNWCVQNWTARDFGDLLAWHNLAWIDPLFWDDAEIAGWLKQGKDFTLSDRKNIYAKQREIIGRIIPQHKKMQDAGQLEVTTTPYTHPILPLLADTNSGRVAVPQMALPEERFQWESDIPLHLTKAWQMYQERMGCNPRGLWPSEQSVSPVILPHIRQQGFKWICSDEAVLGWSKNHFFHRDEAGNVTEPELMYRPYRLETPHGDLAIVFRDHRLSDLVGFTYSNMNPRQAASDLIGHLEAIAESLQARQGGGQALAEPWLVTIALDGENCCEYYDRDGLPFLDALYSKLSKDDDIRLVTVEEFISLFPPTETIKSEQLHSGSWVDGSFTTWIGDPVKNRAWDLLTAARETLAKHPEATPETNPEVWEALYAAEGSDWFWWFGEGHSSNHDAMFDSLFREHLRAIYLALNEPIPEILNQPVEEHEDKGDRTPQGFIHPIINGIGDEQDWDRAGRMEIGGAMGTMHRSSTVQRVFYGLDHLNFYLRFDFLATAELGKDIPGELHLLWYYPGVTMYNSPLPLAGLPNESPLNYYFHHHLTINLRTESVKLTEAEENHQWHIRATRSEARYDQCIEVSVPWADLQIDPDSPLEILAVFGDRGEYRSFVPEDKLIRLQAP